MLQQKLRRVNPRRRQPQRDCGVLAQVSGMYMVVCSNRDTLFGFVWWLTFMLLTLCCPVSTVLVPLFLCGVCCRQGLHHLIHRFLGSCGSAHTRHSMALVRCIHMTFESSLVHHLPQESGGPPDTPEQHRPTLQKAHVGWAQTLGVRVMSIYLYMHHSPCSGHLQHVISGP